MKKEIRIENGVVTVTGVTADEVASVMEKYKRATDTGEMLLSDIIVHCEPPRQASVLRSVLEWALERLP